MEGWMGWISKTICGWKDRLINKIINGWMDVQIGWISKVDDGWMDG